MAIIKCKMCGGDIELSADKTCGICSFCGSTMTFPKIEDEQRAALFNRGNHFRRIGEFDKALSVYENIVREDDRDAEAHWCCALCRFGIEYVEDPATLEYLPTCHRASFNNFLEDVDYQAAIRYSDGLTRRQYEKDARKIAEVQRGILMTSSKEDLQKAGALFEALADYKDASGRVQQCLDEAEAVKKDIAYEEAMAGEKENTVEALLQAAERYQALGNWKDASQRAVSCRQEAERCKKAKARRNSILCLSILAVVAVIVLYAFVIHPGIRRANVYSQAEAYLAEGEDMKAAFVFGSLPGYKDAEARSRELWGERLEQLEHPTVFSCGCFGGLCLVDAEGSPRVSGASLDDDATQNFPAPSDKCLYLLKCQREAEDQELYIQLNTDGTVTARTNIASEKGFCEEVNRWSNIIKMKADTREGKRVLGLGLDGKLHCAGYSDDAAELLHSWENLVDFDASANGGTVVGLHADGTAVSVRVDTGFATELDAGETTDFVKVVAGDCYALGLRADGTVYTIGVMGQPSGSYVSNWTDVVRLYVGDGPHAGDGYSAAVTADGRVLTAGTHGGKDMTALNRWRSIKALFLGRNGIAGLKTDGTVRVWTNGDSDSSGLLEMKDWTDIVALSPVSGDGSHPCAVGYHADGTVEISNAEEIGTEDFAGIAMKIPH